MEILPNQDNTIWIFNHYATNMYFDEGGRHYEFAIKLKEKGYNPIIFCSNIFHTSTKEVDTMGNNYVMKQKKEIPFVFIKSSTYTGNGISRVINMTTFAKNLYYVGKKMIKNGNIPTVILASSVHPLTLVIGILLSRRFHIPVISEIRDLWPEAIFQYRPRLKKTPIGWCLEKGEKWIYDNSNAIIFTKEGDIDYLHEKKWLKQYGGTIDINKIYYINNGVNFKKYNLLIETNQINDSDLMSEKFKVVYVGAIRPVNNIDKILDAAKLMSNEKNIIFLIYGEGIERKRLEERLIKENIDNVKFKGFVEKNKIPYILSKSSVNLLNYSDKQFNWSRGNSSNKLFEYMASGKPIISTVKMGYSLVERYNCGVELDSNDSYNLAKEILNMTKMKEAELLKIRSNCLKAAKEFDYGVHSKKLFKIIEKVQY